MLNGMKYIGFFDGNKLIEESHPIYKQRRKNNFVKIGTIIEKYPNGAPQTKVPTIEDDFDDIPF